MHTERSRVHTERSRGGELYIMDSRLGFARRGVFDQNRGDKGLINHTMSSSSPLIDHIGFLLLDATLHCP